MPAVCTSCGFASPPGFRFCGGCGAELDCEPEQPPREERRVVTVIFVDLVGFTARAERLDPEDVRAVLTPYYALLRGQIEAFGGTVEKFIGDAVMGVFGAPVAHGDDPERAVRAALRIQEGIAQLDVANLDRDLAIRIGVNTGEAIVTLDARPGDGEAMIAGDVVNTAARLESAAPPSGILVGEDTYRCTLGSIDYEPQAPLVVKGKASPVAAWRVRGAPGSPGERFVSNVPMIGRDAELARLSGVWDRVVAERRPYLVTILGLPGVGKSRLAAELMAHVGNAGGRVVFGRSLPYGESSAYGAFAQQVRRIAGILGDDPPAVAVEKLRRTTEALVDDADEVVAHVALMLGVGAEGEEVRDRQVLFGSATRLVQGLADRRPTVLVFSDLHWADSSLLDLIEAFAARVNDAPLLLLTVARSELETKRPDWAASGPSSVALSLESLGQQDACELAVRLLARGAQKRLRQTAQEIGAAGEGNPLFIEELIACAVERSSDGTRELPTSIRGIIAARLDAIPAPERAALLNASVMGRVFWDGALARVAASPGDVGALLDSLQSRDLVRREAASRFRGQQQFRFKHALIRDVAYAALPRLRRRTAHAAVAAFLEELDTGRDSPAALGHHWLEAGEPGRAIEYLVTAADQASRGWAKEEAIALYRQAMALVPDDDQARRRALRLKLAVAQQMLYHVGDAQSRRGMPTKR
jgi:class 3 adenylate cyclase